MIYSECFQMCSYNVSTRIRYAPCSQTRLRALWSIVCKHTTFSQCSTCSQGEITTVGVLFALKSGCKIYFPLVVYHRLAKTILNLRQKCMNILLASNLCFDFDIVGIFCFHNENVKCCKASFHNELSATFHTEIHRL